MKAPCETQSPESREPKVCVTCGRAITWRKKWARDWAAVKYCSAACRRGTLAADAKLEASILALLNDRERGATICPSEVARAVSSGEWRPLMEPVRRAARRLVAAGAVEITQGGRAVDPSTARGAIRIRKRA
jgi:hypothetical protein